MKLTVGEEDHAETDGDDEEAYVSNERLLANFELTDKRHGACDNSRDEAGGSYQLADCHTAAVGTHSGEGAEDVG